MSCAAVFVAWRRLARMTAVLLVAAGPVRAEDIDRGSLDEGALPGLEQVGGFIVDRTITHFGAEFARQFSAQWRDLPGTEGVDLAIVERPSARYGSVIYVEHRQRAVARVFLYAGRSGTIRPLAAAAASYVAERTGEETLARLLLKDPDLGRDEFQ